MTPREYRLRLEAEQERESRDPETRALLDYTLGMLQRVRVRRDYHRARAYKLERQVVLMQLRLRLASRAHQ